MNVAHKYAIAFLNVYDAQCSYQDIMHIEAAADFLHDHRRALFLLQVPLIDRAIKIEGLNDLVHRFTLPSIIMRLMECLLDDGKADLLAAALRAVAYRYRRMHAIHKVMIASAVPLAPNDRQELEAIVDEKIAGKKEYRYSIDQTLIAGIRIKTDTLLWEYSIDKQLRDLYHVGS